MTRLLVGLQKLKQGSTQWVACVLCALCSVLAAVPAQAAPEPAERVQVADPYIEFHTGPGRGFPVFFVVAREQWIEILSRHTDWFKVRSADGKVGWAVRQQLEATLTEAGVKKTFRDILLDDYLSRKVEMGVGFGRFKTEPLLKVWAAYRFTDTLSTELTVGQVEGTFSGTDFWHIGVVSEPWSDKRISPFFSVGMGKFKNFPNASLVSAINTNVNMSNATVGVRYYISDRFVARADYSINTAFLSDTRAGEYRAKSIGLSFFF